MHHPQERPRETGGRFSFGASVTSKDKPCQRNPVHIRVVRGSSKLGWPTATLTRQRTSVTGIDQLTQSGPACRIANGISAKPGAVQMAVAPNSWLLNRCVRCARNTQSSWQPSRTTLSLTTVTMACSGSGNCNRCASPATTSRSNGLSGARAEVWRDGNAGPMCCRWDTGG